MRCIGRRLNSQDPAILMDLKEFGDERKRGFSSGICEDFRHCAIRFVLGDDGAIDRSGAIAKKKLEKHRVDVA